MPRQFSLIYEVQLPFVHATLTKHPYLHGTLGTQKYVNEVHLDLN